MVSGVAATERDSVRHPSSGTREYLLAALLRIRRQGVLVVVSGQETPMSGARAIIGDDGIGGAAIGGGAGLIGLKGRVEALAGRLDIVGPPDGGPRLVATIPLYEAPPPTA